MAESPESTDGNTAAPLESLPDGSLSFDQLTVLEEADAIAVVAPLVMEADTNRVTHLDIVMGDTHYYVGWNPAKEQWERLLVITDTAESSVVETAATFSDDETGDAESRIDTASSPEVEDIAEFIWGYVEYTYSDTSELRNIIGEAAEEVIDKE